MTTADKPRLEPYEWEAIKAASIVDIVVRVNAVLSIVQRQEQRIKELERVIREIAQEVAEAEITEHAFGGYDYCVFCSGHEYRMQPFKHEPSCIVLKARALLAQNAPQSH